MARSPAPPQPDESPADLARRQKAQRLGQALRANLKRRKTPETPPPESGED